jgi:hypothetical protein
VIESPVAELITRLAALEAKLDLVLTALYPPAVPSARESLPDRCAHFEASRCGLQDPDARMSLASFTDHEAWRCRGCREQHTGTTGESSVFTDVKGQSAHGSA